MARDPVCEMDVDEQQATSKRLTSRYRGQTYYFCCPSCKEHFDQDPDRYVGRQYEQH
ncbi:MAG: YHS domain-containing protein [Bacteroidetes bacterium]|nr:YHS domain-containing protein [Bacteroidota bacterium]MCL5026921.1 YHS domain-containing protein [Chloroflexota bacterium]